MTNDLHAPGTLFGIGAVLRGLAVGALRQLPLWPVTVVIVVAWGLALLPSGSTCRRPSLLLQHLAAMLAARSAALLTASPLGTALGGPLTTALGKRATLGGSGLATVVLAAVACGPAAGPTQEPVSA